MISSFYFLHVIRKMKVNQDAIVEYTAKAQVNESFYRSNFEVNTSMTGLEAPDFLCFENQNKEELLSEMAKDRPLLIFRIVESSCKPCYLDFLALLQTEFTGNFDVVKGFCTNMSVRELLIFKNANNITFPVYLIPEKPFGWVAEEKNAPYFFVLHPDMKISHVYVPNKDFPDQNKKYLESVKRLLLCAN